MSKENFPVVMEHVFREEGGYVDHPQDPGGATNMGITFNVLREWRGKAITKQDVKNLTKAEAHEIYKKRYWDRINGDELPAGLDLVCMDGSVNSGVGRGPKWLQSALGVTPDGKIGPKTIAAAKSSNAVGVINKACDIRLAFLRNLDGYRTFGKGWEARVARVRKEAIRMASSTPAVEPLPNLGPKPLPLPPDAPITPEPDANYDKPQGPTSGMPKWMVWLFSAIGLVAVILFILTQIRF